MTTEQKNKRKSELLAEERKLNDAQYQYLEYNTKTDLFRHYEEVLENAKKYKLTNTNNRSANVIGAIANRKNKIRSELNLLYPPKDNNYSTVFDCSYVR